MEENIKEEDNIGICCICYNDNLTLSLNCNHIICLECITNIKKLCCPLCRTDLAYLPKKIVNIINNNGNVSTNTNLSLVPLTLSSPLLYSLSINPPPLSSLLSPRPLNNDLLLYEQYFNDLSFIDIDDIIHYGFINDEIGDGGGAGVRIDDSVEDSDSDRAGVRIDDSYSDGSGDSGDSNSSSSNNSL